MLQKSPSVSKSPGAIVAPLVKTNLVGFFLLDTRLLLELKRRDVVNDLHDLDGIAFGIFREGKAEGKLIRFESRDLSCRVKEGSLKKDNALEVFLFLFGHVLQQSIPKTEIKQEFATVTALDLFAMVVFDGHGIQEELKVFANIGLHDVGKTGCHAAHVGTSSAVTATPAAATSVVFGFAISFEHYKKQIKR